MTPAVKAFVLAAFATFEKRNAQLEKRITELEAKIQKLTPQNSSLPPSTQHPHAKPKRPKFTGKNGSLAANRAIPSMNVRWFQSNSATR